MKYCLSSRQSAEYLKKADEIKVKYRDRDIIYDFSQKYPTATIILEMPLDGIEVNWTEITNYMRVTEGRLILCLANLNDIPQCQTLNIKYYYGFPIGTFYELNALKNLGVCYVRLAPPAFFKMDKVKELKVAVRGVPNIAYDAYMPQPNGIFGSWIRPEDLDLYENYIDIIEFEDCDLAKERALYRIYKEDKAWPGELNMLISNFNYPGLNRLIPPTILTQRRLICGQKCQEGSACRLCENYIKLAQEDFIKDIAQKISP